MPLSDLVYQLRLGLLKANLKTRAWQDRYISSETGEFIVSLLLVAFVRDHIIEFFLDGSVAAPFKSPPNR